MTKLKAGSEAVYYPLKFEAQRKGQFAKVIRSYTGDARGQVVCDIKFQDGFKDSVFSWDLLPMDARTIH